MSLLPSIRNDEHFSELFSNDALWKPAIDQIALDHGLVGNPIRGRRGSHIVYRVGDKWIKLMAPIYAKDMAYEIEGLKIVQDKINFVTPKIVAEGKLESWPYVLLTHVEGERIGDIWKDLSLENQITLAEEIAEATHSIGKLHATRFIEERGDWNEFIQTRLQNAFAHHKKKNLDDVWVQNLEEFIKQFSVSEFTLEQPCFMHADLTYDHFLIKNEGGLWKLNGVIDFADCRKGHPEYEMIASLVFLFKKNSKVLRAYLLKIGISEANINRRFSEKLLAWTILHLFSNLNNYFSDEMKQFPNGDFKALAALVFPLS